MKPNALLPLLLLLAACGRAPQRNEQPTPTPTPAAPVGGFHAARAAVLAALKDPDSARFGELTSGKSEAVCGTVDARNGFGGYTGPRAFAWSPGHLLIYDDPPSWGNKGLEAEEFAAMGCTIGPDQARALTVRAELDRSNARLLNPEK